MEMTRTSPGRNPLSAPVMEKKPGIPPSDHSSARVRSGGLFGRHHLSADRALEPRSARLGIPPPRPGFGRPIAPPPPRRPPPPLHRPPPPPLRLHRPRIFRPPFFFSIFGPWRLGFWHRRWPYATIYADYGYDGWYGGYSYAYQIPGTIGYPVTGTVGYPVTGTVGYPIAEAAETPVISIAEPIDAVAPVQQPEAVLPEAPVQPADPVQDETAFEIPCTCPCHCNGVRPCTCVYPCQSEYAISGEMTQLDFHSYAETLNPEQIWLSYQELGLDSEPFYQQTDNGYTYE